MTGRARERTPHEQLQAAVVELLNITGWRHLHVRRSIGKGRQWVTTTNITGWPDLFCWSTRQPGRFLGIEIKCGRDKLSPEQTACLAELTAAGVECHVIRENDLQRLAEILARRDQVPYGAAARTPTIKE